MPAMLRAVLAFGFLCLIACAQRTADTTIDPAEQALLERIQRDHYVRLVRTERRTDGALIVFTRQGGVGIRYRIARPSAEAEPELQRLPNQRALRNVAIEAAPGPRLEAPASGDRHVSPMTDSAP